MNNPFQPLKCSFFFPKGSGPEFLKNRYNVAYAILLEEQQSHCPHFAGGDAYGAGECGKESWTGIRECP
jgi:hypothetical protein